MALVQCRECNGKISTEAIACPHCGAPQQKSAPPPLPMQPQEQTIYSDGAVIVTNMRVMVGGVTYALRNVTSVKRMFTSPQLAGPILVLLGGIFLLLLTIIPFNPKNYQPFAGAGFGGIVIIGSIIWMCCIKTKYHVNLSTSGSEILLLTSKDKAYIEKVVASINEAIVKHPQSFS